MAGVVAVLCVAMFGLSSTTAGAVIASQPPSDVIASENVEPNNGLGNATNVTDGYYADLDITDGDSDFYAVQLQQGDELDASIYFSHDTGDLDMRVYDETGEILDTSVSTTDNETITFPSDAGGTYFVEVYGVGDAAAPYDLEVRTSSGLADAACSLSDTEAPPGSTVFLDASASENVDRYSYDWEGDGNYDAEGDLSTDSHPYQEPGTYQPRVAAVNFSDDSRDVADCGQLVIDENENPDANLTYSPKQPAPGETVTFDPSGTSDPDGDRIILWEWDLNGDGQYEDAFDLGGSRERSFSEPGTYTVGLRVTDEHDAVDETTVTVEVLEPNQEPFPAFSYQPESPVQVGEEVTFDASESSDPDGEIVAYRWDFDGDGTVDVTSNESTVTHSYGTAGSYVAALTVVDDDGVTTTTSRDVTVESAPFSCSVEPRQVAVGEQVTIRTSGGDVAGDVQVDVQGDEVYDYTTRNGTVTHRYESAGSYVVLARAETAAGTEVAECGDVTVESDENQPPVARLDVTPTQPRPGDNVTLDASGSSDPDGTITAYRWDFDGDGTIDARSNESTVTHSYGTAGSYDAAVTVVDDAGATSSTSRDVTVAENQPPVARLNVTPTQPQSGDNVTLDASGSSDPDGTITAYRWDFDGDGTIDRTTDSPTTTIQYTADDQFDPAVTVVDDAGSTDNASQPVDGDGDGGGPDVPIDAEFAIGVLGLFGFGGMGYWVYKLPTGGGDGGPRLPRPPKRLPEGQGLASVETGTFSTPVESGSVTVTGLGFDPDLILLSATNVAPGGGADPATDRTDGWAHGKVRRRKDGTLVQSTMALADDGLNIDAGMGGASDGHALELLVHYDDPPERVLGSVTNTTSDGFEVSFDASGLRGKHADAEFTVLYRAFGFSGEPQISVGHFRTPDVPGTQSIDLGIDADHVMLFATNTIDDVDSHLMTDLPLGFSVGDAVGRGADPAQLVRTATGDPSMAGSVAYAAFDDRALHLQYGYDGAVRGRTTATVTALAQSRMDLEYEKVYAGPNKLGSTDSKLVSYVAMNTGGVRPAIGYFRLPEPGSEEVLAVDTGFRPSMIEFQSFAIREMNAEAVVDAPVSFGWSEGTVIADDGDVRHQVLDETTGPSVPSPPAAGPRLDPRIAASVRTVADGGRITGRDEVTVTRLTDSGFEMVVTDIGTDARTGGEPRPLVFYKAWPRPIGSDRG